MDLCVQPLEYFTRNPANAIMMPVSEAFTSWELPRILEPLGVPWAAHDQLIQVPFRYDPLRCEKAPNWNATNVLINTELLAEPLLEI